MPIKTERIFLGLTIAFAIVLVAMQMRSLMAFPQPNSFRWFGDETWLMSEARQQITTGTVNYPLAIGSTLEHGKGLVLSMTWLSTLLYGVPIALANADPVSTGRAVTAVLSVIVLLALYRSSRMLGAGAVPAAITVVLLAAMRSFFFSSHSARSDLLAGLIVLVFVAVCARLARNETNRGISWWFWYGAIVLFLCFSSSIHLLTLIGPVSLFFLWRLGGFRTKKNLLASTAGAAGVLTVLIVEYYISAGNVTLFSSSASHGQFQDVLSSIPILRPFSRSVQVSNVIIRLKQFWLEAPAIFLLPVCAILAWNKSLPFRNLFVPAICIVLLSWLLLEGAEINYLIHIIPLLFFALALSLSLLYRRWERATVVGLSLIAVLFFVIGIRESISACKSASKIDASNASVVFSIENDIRSNWHRAIKPRVVTEPPTLERLSRDTTIQAMTDHFISFPTISASYDSLFSREHVDFIVLYNSPVYPKDRPRGDPFYQAVVRDCRLIGTYIGTSGDMGRDYFDHSNWQDTVLLFQFPSRL